MYPVSPHFVYQMQNTQTIIHSWSLRNFNMNKQKSGRIVGAGAKLKGNKYEKRRPKNATGSIVTGVKKPKDTRTPTNDEDFDPLQQPDWQFLYQMFASNKRYELLLLRRTAAVAKQVPKLVEDANLNMVLNLFVAGLIVEYVDSWYSKKLNTNDHEFEHTLFHIISDVIGNVCGRLTLESTDYVVLGEECCRILHAHFQRLVPKNPDNGLQLIVDFKSTGLIGRDDDEEIIKRYVKTNHAYFDDGNNGNTYLEILSIKLLEAILPDFDSPLTSPLVLSFVSSLLGDLVLQKTLDVLSSPEFLIKQIYTQVLPRIKNRTKETTLSVSIKDRAKQTCLKLYNVIMASSSTTPSSIDLLRLQAFALVDLVTDFSTRQPLLASSLLFCRGLVELGTYTQQKVNAILISYLRGLVEALDIPGLSCTIMSALGEAIFNFRKESKGNEPMEDSASFSEMIDSIAEAFAQLAPSSFYYQEETSTDLNEFFRNRLQLLTYPELNKLVVLELLDMILGVLYPEITVK